MGRGVAAPTLRDDETGLSQRDLLVLHMDLAGIYTQKAIAAAARCSPENIFYIRKKPLYQLAFKRMQAQMKQAREAALLKVGDKLDVECMSAFDTIASLHKEADSDSVRLSAAKAVFDYAPNGPKKSDPQDKAPQRALFLQLGAGKLKEIKEALSDADAFEVLDLLEHIDWEVEDVKATGAESVATGNTQDNEPRGAEREPVAKPAPSPVVPFSDRVIEMLQNRENSVTEL